MIKKSNDDDNIMIKKSYDKVKISFKFVSVVQSFYSGS